MKKDWKNIEGAKVRFDVGTRAEDAFKEGFPAEVICFTTDGNIVFNGIQYSLSQSEYKALADAVAANTEAIDTKVDKQDGYGLASDRQRTVADWCDEHILVDNNAEVPFLKATDKGAEGYAVSHCVDGNTYRTNAYIPLATDKASGVMSAADHADFSAAKEDIETLFESIDATDETVTANTEAIAANKAAIAKCEADIASAGNNTKAVVQLSTSLVLPIVGIDSFANSSEFTAYDAQWQEPYGSLPFYSTKLNSFFISTNLKHYVAWTGFTDIPDSDKYGSTQTLYYDGKKLYRYTGKELVELTSASDTTELEKRVKELESQLASVMALLTLQQ